MPIPIRSLETQITSGQPQPLRRLKIPTPFHHQLFQTEPRRQRNPSGTCIPWNTSPFHHAPGPVNALPQLPPHSQNGDQDCDRGGHYRHTEGNDQELQPTPQQPDFAGIWPAADKPSAKIYHTGALQHDDNGTCGRNCC